MCKVHHGGGSLRNVAFLLALTLTVSGGVQAQQDFINLADVVVGGDGSGFGGGPNGDRQEWALSQDTGDFLLEEDVVISANGDTNGVNPAPVAGTDLVDVAFFIDAELAPIAINSAGVIFEFLVEDDPTNTAGGFGPILSNTTVEFPSANIEVAGRNDWQNVVTIHSAAGVTFNLDELRAANPDQVNFLSVFVGEGACSCGGASGHIIYSDDTSIIEDPNIPGESYRGVFAEGEGEAYFAAIPAEAKYLTFAAGAFDADFCCDTIGFASPRILASDDEIDFCTEMQVNPAEVSGLLVGGSAQLAVTCFDSLGLPNDVTEAGTSYGSSDEAVATVSAGGFITAVGTGTADITVTNTDQQFVVPVAVGGAVIDLGDIVAGGDGTGLGGGPNGDRKFWGLDQDTGVFLTEAETGLGVTSDQDEINPTLVPDSDFINVAFFIDETPLIINTEGVTVDFPVADIPTDTGTGNGGGFGPIFSNVTGALPDTTITVAGVSSWSTCVGIHSAAGVTFDLEELRAEHGEENIHTFSTVAGESACTCNSVNMYIIYSNADGIVNDPSIAGAPFFAVEIVGEDAAQRYLGAIPPEAEFLTLATGARDTQFCCDAATFAEARLLPESEVNPNCSELAATANMIVGATGSEQLDVFCVDGLGIQRNVSAAVNGTTYSVDPEGVVDVSADGVVSGVTIGDATVTSMNNGLMAQTVVSSQGAVCDTIEVSPSAGLLRPGNSKQLTVSCVDALGNERDVPFTYSVAPEGVVTVDQTGLVTAIAEGEAQVSVENARVIGTANFVVNSNFLELSDVVVGGDGTGVGGGPGGDSQFWSLDQDTGGFLLEEETGGGVTSDTTGVNPTPVPDSEFVDVAFFIDETPLAINSEGVAFDWPVDDIPNNTPGGFGPVMSNNIFGGGLEIAGRTDFDTGIAIHSAAGVTFDLAALRATHGAENIGTLSTFVGEGSCSCGGATGYIIYSNADGIVNDPSVEGEVFSVTATEGQGEQYLAAIPAEAEFVTFASGALDADFCCDTMAWGEARIFGSTGPQFKRGECNGDADVNISDAQCILNWLFLGGDTPGCIAGTNANADQVVNIADPTYLLNFLFLGGLPMQAPNDCGAGTVPADTALGCDTPPNVCQ